ncbi:MAG: phosphatidate cytidylyltransferase [Planctomycetes bacterium]|nr:phosphatidate cytidylyltransferase [Planctomycetota bacterium]
MAAAGIWLASRTNVVSGSLRTELWKRTVGWAVIVPLILGAVLLGAAWHIAAVTLLSLGCFHEYARATGLFREKLVSLSVVLGIFAVSFAALDHWYGFFMALFPLSVGLIAASSVTVDQPKGYIQRVALGVFAFMFFGCALGHLSYMANDWEYRPRVLLLLAGVQLNDVFAFTVGKALGQRKLAPNTSPNKTVAGSLGAMALTTPLVAFLGHHVFRGTALDHPLPLLLLGIVISISGQLGDLMLSSIKRDIGIKDMGTVIPGHGGLLDRFNSLLLSAPAFFHFVRYFVDVGLDQPSRILTGG